MRELHTANRVQDASTALSVHSAAVDDGAMIMAALARERKAFKKLNSELEKSAMGKFALVHDDDLIGTYDSFQDAAVEAVRRFGRGPFLIRQVGAPDPTLPASVVYARFENA